MSDIYDEELEAELVEKIPTEVFGDKEKMMKICSIVPDLFEYTTHDLKNDIELVKVVVSVDSEMIEHVSESLKQDRDIILIAYLNDYENSVLKYVVSENLHKDKEFMLEAVENKGYNAYKELDESLLDDIDIAKKLLHSNLFDIEKLSNTLRENDEILNMFFSILEGFLISFSADTDFNDDDIIKLRRLFEYSDDVNSGTDNILEPILDSHFLYKKRENREKIIDFFTKYNIGKGTPPCLSYLEISFG